MIKERLIYRTIVGSQAYGTAIATSDMDYKGIYIQKNDDILCFRYNEQIEVGKDECYYEIRRFLQLAQSANPTILEMLFMDDKHITRNSPEFELLRQHKNVFLTKKCSQSFGGYAVAQIKKAKGLDKKMNWEQRRVERKTPLDFCYVYDNGKTISLAKFLTANLIIQEHCGLVALDHFKDGYALYYDNSGEIGFRGVITDESDGVRVSSIPKGFEPLAVISYNKDGYSKHCKDYNAYTVWLEKRNTQRYVDVQGHNQQIDGKNLLHCRRLLDMAIEIAKTQTLTVLRPNADYLLKIRRGEVPLNEIIEQAEYDISEMDKLYDASDLPSTVDMGFVNDLLLEIRHFKKP
jgi:hypothetical protein